MGSHFNDRGMKFLASLARHNERPWFDARKEIYEAEVKTPMLAVIAEVNDELLMFAPEFVRDPKKCMMRIYRDIRFSKDKRPYKTHAAAWWARQGMEKTSGAGYYLEVSPAEIRVAAGVYMPDKQQLLAIRRMLLDRHQELRLTMKVKGMIPIDTMKMARAPKGFADQQPANDLIQQRQWGLMNVLPPEAAIGAGFVKQVAKSFRLATPMVALLNDPLLPRTSRPLL